MYSLGSTLNPPSQHTTVLSVQHQSSTSLKHAAASAHLQRVSDSKSDNDLLRRRAASKATTSMATTLVPIRQGRSAPAGPNLPSLLTTLPPEICNKIYDLLFVQSEPIEITSPDYRCLNSDGNTLVAIRKRATRSSLVHAVALLRTYRQIYHEATGMLYSQNDFILSPHHRQTFSIGDWYHDIALQTRFLRRLTIDVHHLGLARHPWIMHQSAEVLPLLRIIWDPISPDLDISLYSCSAQTSSFYDLDQADQRHLNSTLRLLGNEDMM
jgi:hypothetical protein